MRTAAGYVLLTALLLAASASAARAEITSEQVRESIDRGVAYLKSKQNKARGNWPDHPGQPGALTSLCALALLSCGEDPKSPEIQQALDYLRSLGRPEMTYAAALETMVFCAAQPKEDLVLIRRNAEWLQGIQITAEPRKGSWSYTDPGKKQGSGDNSNTQFALLALHEAERAGVVIRDDTWRMALNHWLSTQRADGSWGYFADQPGTGSMTCAGIASVVIASGKLREASAKVTGDDVLCCQAQPEDDALARALDWLGRNFSVRSNPSTLGGNAQQVLGQTWLLYYLYGVERVGRMTGRRFIGDHDWYREGAELLVSHQDRLTGYWTGTGHAENNPLVATSLSLLFLSKGRRPVVIAKLRRPGEDWNHHQEDIANLTRYIEQRWRRDLTWQVIEARLAKVEDLLQTPVLFITGRDALELTAQEKINLRDYVNQGGFIFAESCCDGQGFDRDFRALMAEIFPDSALRLLPPDHPIWYAEEPVDARFVRPLYGLDACCRTSVVYCPQNLSCFWELSQGGRETKYSDKVKAEIAACSAIGANVLAYATGRELRDKLDVPQIVASDPRQGPPARGTLYVAKLAHGGGSDDAAAALSNLLTVAGRQLDVRISSQKRLIAPTDPQLAEFPISFLHGRRAFRFTPEERAALAEYLKRGGFLFADAICGNAEFATAFRREIEAMFPDAKLARIPTDDPLLSTSFRGYDLSSVTLRDPQFRVDGGPLQTRLYKTAPVLEGLQFDGRYAIIFSPYDISCALENSPSLECKGYIREDAARIGVNILLYGLQQ